MRNTDTVVDSSPHRNVTDSEALRKLVYDCIAGKRTEQRKFFEHYAPAVFNIIKRYEFNNENAQELLNDSFYKIFTALPQYSWQGPIEAWMRRIAVNTITDYLRKHMKSAQFDQVTFSDATIEAYVDNEAVSNLSYKELIGCLHQLTPAQRLVFNLSVFECMTHGEISAIIGTSEGNSRWILNDARKTLRRTIMNRGKQNGKG